MKSKNWQEPFDSLELKKYVDKRGMLFEILRFKDYNIPGNGQLYSFSILSGQRRGDHYHLKKQEWFTCVYGEAIVLLTSSSGINKSYIISDDSPQIIYAAPGTSHALINNKDSDAIIVSYGSKQHDSDDPDTFSKNAFIDYENK